MAWVAINNNYAANDETGTVVTRKVRFNGYDSKGYTVCDDPIPAPSNKGIQYESFDARVMDANHGGCTVVHLPLGVSYEEAVEMIRFYGQL